MILLILILGFGLRIISLNQSLWIDEATSALTTRMPLTYFFQRFMPGDFHPPLYYLILRLWSLLFGSSEIAIRSLSIVFALGTIYLVYLLLKETISEKAGIIAALLLSTSGLHIYYSQEARMYSMSTFLVTFAIFSFVKILKRDRVEDWIVFSTILGIIGLTDYLPLLILPIFWIYGFWIKKNISWFRKLFMSHIILGVFALLWLPTFLKQLVSGVNVSNHSPAWVQVLGKFSLKDILLIPVKFEIGRVSFDNKFIYAGIILILTAIFGVAFYKARKDIHKNLIYWLWALVPILISLLLSLKLPVLNYFRFLFVLPAIYVVVAIGILNFKKLGKFLLVILVSFNLATSMIYLTNLKFQREDWKNMTSFVEAKRGENSIVVFPSLSQMEAYRYYKPKSTLYGPEGVNPFMNEIWLVRYAQPISDPTDSTRGKIEDLKYKMTNEYDFNGVTVWKYTK